MTELDRGIACAVAAVRAANHSAMRGVLDIPQTCAAVGALVDLTERLPQVVDYLARGVQRAEPSDDRDRCGCDALGPLVGAHEDLSDARTESETLTEQLRSARHYLGQPAHAPD